jgi:hypothetical protein
VTPATLRALRTVALCVLVAGAAGSLIAMMRVGHSAPVFLLVVLRPPSSTPAARFVVVPVASLLLMAGLVTALAGPPLFFVLPDRVEQSSLS